MRKIRNILILAIMTMIMMIPVTANAKSIPVSFYCTCMQCRPIARTKDNIAYTFSGITLTEKNNRTAVAANMPIGTIIKDTNGGAYFVVCEVSNKYQSTKEGGIAISVTHPDAHQLLDIQGKIEGEIYYNKIFPNGFKGVSDSAVLQKYSENESLLALAVQNATPVPDEQEKPKPPAPPEVTADFDILVNDVEIGKGGTIWAERINKITLKDVSSHRNNVVQWRIINKDTNQKYNLGKGKGTTLDINFSDELYTKYISKDNELVIELETVGTQAKRIKTITYKLAYVPVEANFSVIVNNDNKVAEQYPDGAVIDIWEERIERIELADVSNILGRVGKWQIFNSQKNDWETLNSLPINWKEDYYTKYIDESGHIGIRMETISGDAGYTSAKEVKLNPVKLNQVKDKGVVLKVETDGNIVEYEMQENKTNEIYVTKNSKITMVGEDITEYRLWDPNAQETIIIKNGKLNNILEYEDSLIKLSEDSYKARIGITRSNGTTPGYDVEINIIKNEIAVKYGEKDYEATEENPIREGVYLGHIVVKNSTGKAIKEWQLWSQKEGKYVTIEGTENEKLMYLGLENYNKKAHDIYEIKVKAIFEDGSEMIREIYHKMVRIESPTNQEVVSANQNLEIKWNGEKGRKYHVRMVKYYTAEKGNIVAEEIEPGVIWEGSSYIINKNKLDENACYRIAVKEAEGQYHDIIVISTSDKLEGTIENYDEIKESKEGETVSVELSGKAANDKYLLVIYKENGQIIKRLEANTGKFEIIKESDKAEKGTYKIELSVIRGGITHKANTYTITIK